MMQIFITNEIPMRKIFFSLMMLLMTHSATAAKEAIQVGYPPYNPGFFSAMCSVAGFLYQYDHREIAGIKIDFQKDGAYYDKLKGPNSWNYYFEPIMLGDLSLAITRTNLKAKEYVNAAQYTESLLSPRQVNTLIRKYIKLKPHVQEKLDHFVQAKFDAPTIIGIHYRGTDKKAEAPRISYDEVATVVAQKIQSIEQNDFKIFIATDEADFVEYMKVQFPRKVICQKMRRAKANGTPLHFQKLNGYQLGLNALLDCLLLARCDILIRTSSNLSLWSTYFNPSIPVVNLSQRY